MIIPQANSACFIFNRMTLVINKS